MAFGKNTLIMTVGFGLVAAGFYGYTLYQENPELKLSDLANPEKLKALVSSPKPSVVDEQKNKVLGKLDEARKAQAAREESMARQTGEANVHAVGDSLLEKPPSGAALDAKGAVKAYGSKAAASAAAADAALEGKAIPGAQQGSAPSGGAATGTAAKAPEEPPKPKDPATENDRLLALVRGITPKEEEPEKAPKKEAPKRLAMVDPGMEHTLTEPAVERHPPTDRKGRGKKGGILERTFGHTEEPSAPREATEEQKAPHEATEEEKAPRPACKKPPRDQMIATLKKDSSRGLGSFAELWTRKYGACWDGLISVAADPGQDLGLRYFSLRAALEVGGRDSADGVAKLLKDKNPGLRCLSLLGLGEMGDKVLAEKVTPLLQDSAMVVRECALTATVRTQGAESLSQVIRVISDPKNYVKGRPLSIVKRGFDLLDAMGVGTSQSEACGALKEKMQPRLFSETTRKWSVCAESQAQ